MLNYLSIQNLAIVESLSLSFEPGMTVLTGETGAGKSILIDALNLSLGERAESGWVRHNCPLAEVIVNYDLQHLPPAISQWLSTEELNEVSECIIRRTLSPEGRSRSYINGHLVPLNQLRELGEHLVQLQGQHQHQALLKSEYQCQLLDNFAKHEALCLEVREHYQHLNKLQKEQARLLGLEHQNEKLALLQYQLQEIEELNLQKDTLKNLGEEHSKLSEADTSLSLTRSLLEELQNESGTNLITTLQSMISQLCTLKDPALKTVHELLNNAIIQLEEATNELRTYHDNIILDPERLASIDQLLSQIHAIARKHRIKPEDLFQHQSHLKQEADTLTGLQSVLAKIESELQTATLQYRKSAERLSESRKQAALQLEKLITERLHTLEMPNAQFEIQFTTRDENHWSAKGQDEIEFLVSLNPGHPLKPLRKIASGGELSRISLAIQVITAQKMTTPTLIFDEVDVGISGKTAELVGQLLRKLGESTQVLCVTHLPQVAALGHHHFKVTKTQTTHSTSTSIEKLDLKGRIEEVARMLGGVNITPHALAHAKDLLESPSV